MIVGLVGQAGSGKSTLAKWFVEKGFQHISLSDLLREEMAKTKCTDLIMFGHDYRAKHGADSLVRLADCVWERGRHVVLSSFRIAEEITKCNQQPASVTLYLLCPKEVRWTRIRERGRDPDTADFWDQIDDEDHRITSYRNGCHWSIESAKSLEEVERQAFDAMERFFGKGWIKQT